MTHGVEAYFIESARSARRISTIAAGLGSGMLAVLLATLIPSVRHPVESMLHEARFGFEGSDQFVRRITLQHFEGTSAVLRDVGAVQAKSSSRGGAVHARRSQDPRSQPETRRLVVGPGFADDDLVSRAVSRFTNVPVVRSEDLVIEHAAMPVYPQEQSDRGVEGKVMVQALVDTAGRVVDVQLLASSGVEPFERSAQEAVWQYRFRPYHGSAPAGTASEVYAIFRFAFRVY